MKKLIALVLALLMMCSLLACTAKTDTANGTPASTDTAAQPAADGDKSDDAASDTADAEPYRIALMAPMTGNNAQYGITYQTACEIYIEQCNAEGGINGHPVELVVYDDKGDAKEALNVANLIASDPTILAVIGSQASSPSLAAAPVFQEAGIPMISPQASHPDFCMVGDHIFGLSCLANYEGTVVTQRMIDDGFHKVAIIYASDDYGLNIYQTAQETVAAAGDVEIVAAETYVSGQTTDFTPLLSKIKSSGAEALYISPSYSDAAMIITQMRQLDCEFKPYGCSMLYKQEFLDIAGEAAEGVNICNFFKPGNTEEPYASVEKAYTEKTGAMMDVYVTHAYDAMSLLCGAIREVGTDDQAICDWLANVKDWPGCAGPITFDEQRRPVRQLFWFEVQDGKFVSID